MSVLVSATSNAGFRPEHTVWSVARAPQLGVGPNTSTVREDRAVEHTSIEDGALPNKRRIDSLVRALSYSPRRHLRASRQGINRPRAACAPMWTWITQSRSMRYGTIDMRWDQRRRGEIAGVERSEREVWWRMSDDGGWNDYREAGTWEGALSERAIHQEQNTRTSTRASRGTR
ncbi:hypothetical protein BKA93DRAFT_326687 [Sparassis latifolia]